MENIKGIKSKCCNADVSKYYNSRNPGHEEEFICSKCDKECDFEEVMQKSKQESWEEVKSKIINIIAKLDNGSHSSNQLQGIDEELTELFKSLLASQREEMEKAELRGIGKILDILWENSYYSMGKQASDRIEKELKFFFGENWCSDMYKFINPDNNAVRPTCPRTLKELTTPSSEE